MRLDFNVLWVDDQPTAIDSQITRIRTQMADEGFSFNPTKCSSLQEIDALIGDNVFQDEVDLILVDWDLGHGLHGEDVIAKVREAARFKDVVFYSGQSRADELRRLAFEKNLEGIYCASREELVEEVLGVFESLVKKVLDLDHTRGIVMGATSDIDYIVHSCIVHFESTADEAGKAAILAEAVKRVKERAKDITKQIAKLEAATDLAPILAAHMIFTANDRLRMLSGMLKGIEKHKNAAATVKTYMDDVVPHRNSLGHMVLAPEGRPQAIATSEGKEVSLDQMRELRRQILRLRADFRALADGLKG